MSDTYRGRNQQSLILSEVNRLKAGECNSSIEQTVSVDAQRVLEAIIAEYGDNATFRALKNQGFQGNLVRYLLTALYEIAIARRAVSEPHSLTCIPNISIKSTEE